MTSTAKDPKHPAAATSAADGAMQLLNKFESLQRSIEEKRSGIEGCRRQQDDLRDRIQNAREERTGMEQTIARAEEETEQLNQQVKEALEKDALEEDRRVQVLQKETEALRNLEVTKQYVQEQRQAENESSVEFRVACKRLCVAALAAGEPMAPSYGLLSLHAMERDDLGEDMEDLEALVPVRAGPDEEMDRCSEEHAKLLEARDRALQELLQVQEMKKATQERARSSQDKKEQLKSQLQRIRGDVLDLQERLDKLKKETRETEMQTRNLQRERAPGQRDRFASSSFVANNPITPSPHIQTRTAQAGPSTRPRNPYAKTTTTNRPAAGASTASGRPGNPSTLTLPKPVSSMAGNTDSSFDRQQHPHRTGRVRVDRQFCTTLGITPGHEEEQVESPMEGEVSNAQGNGDNATHETVGSNISLLDSDDEDIDELLSFRAFS